MDETLFSSPSGTMVVVVEDVDRRRRTDRRFDELVLNMFGVGESLVVDVSTRSSIGSVVSHGMLRLNA